MRLFQTVAQVQRLRSTLQSRAATRERLALLVPPVHRVRRVLLARKVPQVRKGRRVLTVPMVQMVRQQPLPWERSQLERRVAR